MIYGATVLTGGHAERPDSTPSLNNAQGKSTERPACSNRADFEASTPRTDRTGPRRPAPGHAACGRDRRPQRACSTPPHFSQIFRAEYGMTPSEYRQRAPSPLVRRAEINLTVTPERMSLRFHALPRRGRPNSEGHHRP
ncbi:helix-turn-helix transcriptional regulator [Rhodococcus oxybenzonivorans]|uniref:helix-turn-helix transcriptional regulator n=1 Tax=Rhodococcus oxybenzonivorans TaxID=1990687 RepID=UPI003AACB97B